MTVHKNTNRLVCRFSRGHLITPIDSFIPVSFRNDFRILLNIFKAYLGLAPSYIAEMWNPYEHICSLSSSAGILLAFRKSLPNFKGDRAFAIRARKPERNWLSRSGSLKFVFSLLSLSCLVCLLCYLL